MGTGANLQFVFICGSCREIAKAPHSASVGTFWKNELAACLCVVGRDCRISFKKLSRFIGGMNAPPPTHLETYLKTAKNVCDASMQVASDAMRDAVKTVRKVQEELAQDGGDVLDVCLSYDDSREKRCHMSQSEVGEAIELKTGLVLDFSVQSK